MSVTKVLQGLSIIGTAMGDPGTSPQDEATAMVMILTGQIDDDLRNVLFFQINGHAASLPSDLVDSEVERRLNQLKDFVRAKVQRIFDCAAQEDEQKRKENLERTRQELAASNQPHELGTVAQIAERFGISKSEVRRLKAAGLLHTLKA